MGSASAKKVIEGRWQADHTSESGDRQSGVRVVRRRAPGPLRTRATVNRLVVTGDGGLPLREYRFTDRAAKVWCSLAVVLALGLGIATGFVHMTTAAKALLFDRAAQLPSDELDALVGDHSHRQRRGRGDMPLSPDRIDALRLGSRPTASKLLGGVVLPEWREAVERRYGAPQGLVWPVKHGWFVRGYGSGEDGYHLAVDVAGKVGAPVRASAAALVGYADDGIRGYGNVVLLIHPGGWVTMYAHNKKNLVRAGDFVKRGEVIALLGNTGISKGPHVHYEFMAEGMNCDPSALFEPGIRHRDGHLTPMPRIPWTAGERRPRRITCGQRRRHPHSRFGHHAHSHKTAAATVAEIPSEEDTPEETTAEVASEGEPTAELQGKPRIDEGTAL